MPRALAIKNETDAVDLHIALLLSGGAVIMTVLTMIIFRTIM